MTDYDTQIQSTQTIFINKRESSNIYNIISFHIHPVQHVLLLFSKIQFYLSLNKCIQIWLNKDWCYSTTPLIVKLYLTENSFSSSFNFTLNSFILWGYIHTYKQHIKRESNYINWSTYWNTSLFLLCQFLLQFYYLFRCIISDVTIAQNWGLYFNVGELF